MKQLINMPLGSYTRDDYPDLEAFCAEAGCDGLEMIWCGEDLPQDLPASIRIGYHLAFYPDWLDFWNGDTAALRRKFGADAVWKDFYGGDSPDRLVEYYRADLDRAEQMGARYAVYHVSDVSLDETFTFRWEHSHEAVIDGAAEIINRALEGRDGSLLLLVENQWWPGFTFTDPALTARLLDAIEYPNKGIMLDTGHLMNANHRLRTEAEGAAYIEEMLDLHGALSRQIRGVHCHYSLSGEYVEAHTGFLPAGLPEEYYARFAVSYRQVLNIDRHQPWHDPAIGPVIRRIDPEFLVHELSVTSPADRMERIRIQQQTLGLRK